MMHATRTETVQTPDGKLFDAHVAIPSGGHGRGVLLVHEVVGVNDYIRDVAQRLAGLGCVVLAPDVFWRQQPGLALDSSDQSNIAPAIEVSNQWDSGIGLGDLGVALEHLKALQESAGPHRGYRILFRWYSGVPHRQGIRTVMRSLLLRVWRCGSP